MTSVAQHSEIRRWMARNAADCVDPQTGEVNCTLLAEGCAAAFGRHDWLDDDTHPVWDFAIDRALAEWTEARGEEA